MPQQAEMAMSNLEYDLLTVLQNKAEAIKAYDTYIEDASRQNSQPCVELFRKLRDADLQQAQEVREHLQQVMVHGRM
jgi:rubrerythrin